jgi:predicted 3-demethylubiquinone-9 3-methyltransferase (glyoxalase superfamily)
MGGKMQIITPHLWFDKEAKEAAEFYASTFANSKIKNVTVLEGTPSGSVDLVSMEIAGQDFALISAGPLFKFNPSVSFLVACTTKDEVDTLFKQLSTAGTTLMDLGEYAFSERYAWIQDKYGLSWQLMFMGARPVTQKITPTLMFTEAVCGKAEEAVNFYASVFHNAEVGDIMRYAQGEAPDKEGTVKHASFTLEGQQFAAMDSARVHGFAFNEAISLMVRCETQDEIDHYWHKLSADPKAEQCGWLKDKYGFSWQIVPTAMDYVLKGNDKERIARVTQAFLKMKKFDIAGLLGAYEGE